MKTIIERGASWTLEETKLLLRLWGKDLVERQSSGAKRTKEVYEQIADKFMEIGHERTADQVRTRIFNMIAEYRRILKDDNPERERKCIFFAALHKIYQARHMDDVKSALDDYEPDYPYSPGTRRMVLPLSDDEFNSDSEATDGNESINHSTIANASSNLTATNNDTTINTTNSNKNNAKADSKDGDSNNNNNEKGSSGNASHHHHQGASASAPTKKIKLDSPKASNQLNQSATTSSSTQNSHSDHANTNSKQNKTSSITSSVTQIASTSNSAGVAPATPSSSSLPTLAAASTSSIASSSAQRHQSLLLPHATAATSSSSTTPTTPINKLTTSGTTNAPSYININSTKLPIIRTNQLIGHSNGNESINLNGTTTRLPTTAAITSHQLYQAPVNTFDVTSSALLIDRMFAHLSRESENMREWIALEKERLALERTRRQQETEREVRRERVLIDTLMRFQEQWLSFLTRLDPRIIENSNEQPPELKIPAKEISSTETSQSSAVNSAPSTNHPETSKQ